jgi:hypothetical protein
MLRIRNDGFEWEAVVREAVVREAVVREAV